MDKKDVNETLAFAVATYIKGLEDVIRQQREEIAMFQEKNNQLSTSVQHQQNTIHELTKIPHKTQDADVIVGAITGNVPRETWENVVKGLKQNYPFTIYDSAVQNKIQSELAELIERSLEYKWGR